MAILIRCPACGKGFRVRDEREGETLTCSACDETFLVRAGTDQDNDERPDRHSDDESPAGTEPKKGSSLGLILVLGAGALFLLCGGGGVGGYFVYKRATRPRATITVNGKTMSVDAGDMKKGFEALEKEMEKQGLKADARKGKSAARPDGKDLAKAFGKDLDKAFQDLDKKMDKVFNPDKDKGTIAAFTLKPELVPLSTRAHRLVVPRGRQSVVIMRTGGPFPPFAKPGDPEPRLERFGVPDGKLLGGISLKGLGEGIHDVSPDGSLVALAQGGIGLDVAIVSLIDGKVLARNWKPIRKQGDKNGHLRDVLARAFRFLAPNRWLVIYNDDSAEVFSSPDGKDWQRFLLRAATYTTDTNPFRPEKQSWGISKDGKTLAFWNGQSFELIDTLTGAVRLTAPLTPKANEKNLDTSLVLFSPDGKQLLANMGATVTSGRSVTAHYFLTRWDLTGDGPPVRLPITKRTGGYGWWGNRHVFQLGGKSFSHSGVVYEAATGKPLADFSQQGQGLKIDDADGKLRFFTRGFLDKNEGFLFQARFPGKLLAELEKRAGSGKLPVLHASKDGLGIRP